MGTSGSTSFFGGLLRGAQQMDEEAGALRPGSDNLQPELATEVLRRGANLPLMSEYIPYWLKIAQAGLEQPTVERKLRGKADGDIELAAQVIAQLDMPDASANGSCVEVSLTNFVNACKAVGVGTTTLFGAIEVPLIAGVTGATIPLSSFFYLWYSRADVPYWLQLPTSCRGGGAPGALLFADLIEDRALKFSSDSWPEGLKPGAFVQLWNDEETYHQVRDVGGTKESGHSLIFHGYGATPGKIVVSDQMGLNREANYPILEMNYVIGGNLKKAELV